MDQQKYKEFLESTLIKISMKQELMVVYMIQSFFREQLTKYGMNLDEMCLINSLECDPNP